MKSQKTLEVHNIDLEVFTTQDDTVLVDRVRFDTEGAPEGSVTFKPRTTETVEMERGGAVFTETNTVRYTVSQFLEDYGSIGDAQEACSGSGTVELEAIISSFNPSHQDPTEDDKEYYYIDREDRESIVIRNPEKASDAESSE